MALLAVSQLAVLAAAFVGIAYAVFKRPPLHTALRGVSIGAALAQAAWLFAEGAKFHYCPLLDPWGLLAFLTGSAIVAGVAAERSWRSPQFLIAILVLSLVAVAAGLAFFPEPGVSAMPMKMVLAFHIFLNIIGIMAMALAFIAGILFSFRSRSLKNSTALDHETFRWPSLTALDRFFVRSLGFGLFFLTFGVLLGVGMGPTSLPEAVTGPWYFDPKVLFTCAGLILFAIVWAIRRRQGFCTPQVVALSSLGFILIFSGLFISSLFATHFHKF
jgi:ABC-type transport system involved in cytochrome c biogenesis permease subunit